MQYDDERSDPEAGISKSETKRNLLTLQKLAERLLELSPSHWEQLGFAPKMMEALQESHRVKGRNALRRHIRHLGKLLRAEDSERIAALLRNIDARREEENSRFHRLENLRDRLMNGGEAALTELLRSCPGADRQRIQQFVRSGRRELEQEKPPIAQRKLFKYLKELSLK